MHKRIYKQGLTRRITFWLRWMALLSLVILSLPGSGRVSAFPVEDTSASPATLYAIPFDDGALYVAAGRLGLLATPVYANVTVQGTTSYERSHTLAYDPDTGEYGHAFEGLFDSGASTPVEGTINISTTNTPVLGSSPYIIYKVTDTPPAYLPSTDGWVNLHINPGGVPSDTHVLIMPTNIPPGDPPPGHRLIGQAYSIRASHALTESLQPMTLRLGYEVDWLAGADPHTLSLFAWDGQHWLDLGGTPSFDQHYLSSPGVRRFTTYALMTSTSWRDTFDDISGLLELQGVRLAYGGQLELADGVTAGWATSIPITPTQDFAAWGQVFYDAVITSGTTVTVSVLDGRTGEELLSDVASGDPLNAIDPAAHPSLQLRAALSADAPGETPGLDEWTITWSLVTASWKMYLPLLIRGDSQVPPSMAWKRP